METHTKVLAFPSFPDSVWERPLLPAKLRLALTLLLTAALFPFTFTLSPGCGLDWTLPQAHFEGVDEQGYVAYWEKIGQADLGDGLLIPVNIGFNSHRQSASPTLGQGWILPLLESHVEPVDENSMRVIMPDGWIFVFYRNGNTDSWRGNAGWVGQTDGARFTITAPCGWRVKFDTGKIQEIDTPKDRTITIKYNGPAPVEADIDNTPFVQVEANTATGVAQSITIAGQKISISQAQRPRIQSIMGKTLLTGFDPALSALQYPNGQKETFDFSAPQSLTPTLVVTRSGQPPRNITWDPGTSEIESDGNWVYQASKKNAQDTNVVEYTRTNQQKQVQYFYNNMQNGVTVEKDIDGVQITTHRFISTGLLSGLVRSIEKTSSGVLLEKEQFSYDELGNEIRYIKRDKNGKSIEEVDKIIISPTEYQLVYVTQSTKHVIPLTNR